MSKDKELSKIRSDSIWNSLPPERRKIFEGWLFEERVSYAAARERAQKEWGVEGSLASVGRFYRRIARDRVVDDFEELAETAAEVDGADGKLEGLRASAMKVLSMQLLERAVERGEVKDLALLGRVLTQSEEREIQRGRLALAREKFEFKAAKAALTQLSLLDQIKQEDEAREEARVEAIKLSIFGKPPAWYKDPESAKLA